MTLHSGYEPLLLDPRSSESGSLSGAGTRDAAAVYGYMLPTCHYEQFFCSSDVVEAWVATSRQCGRGQWPSLPVLDSG